MTAARDRLLAGGDQPEQDVPERLGARHLRGAGEVEGTGAVVEQRGIRGTQGRRYGRVGLVPGGADRVEAVALGAEVPRGQVQLPAAGLGVEQGDGLTAGQGGPRHDGRGEVGRAGLPVASQLADGRQKPQVEFFFRGDLWHLGSRPRQSVRRNEGSGASSATSICAFWSDPE